MKRTFILLLAIFIYANIIRIAAPNTAPAVLGFMLLFFMLLVLVLLFELIKPNNN